MNAILNKTQIWFRDICDKTNDFYSKSKHPNSKTHIHKKEYGTVVKEYEFIKPEIGEVNYILNDAIKDCRKKLFHSFQYRCVYDFKDINMENSEEFILTSFNGYMKFKS